MAKLTPVDFDPFAAPAGAKLTPVDYDPFAGDKPTEPAAQAAPEKKTIAQMAEEYSVGAQSRPAPAAGLAPLSEAGYSKVANSLYANGIRNSMMDQAVEKAAGVNQPALGEDAGNGYGKRADGTEKGRGFLGELKRPDGKVSTELSIGVEIDGKETEIPLLVPGLNKAEIDSLLAGKKATDAIVQKAVDHAMARIKSGKNVFAQANEGTLIDRATNAVKNDTKAQSGLQAVDNAALEIHSAQQAEQESLKNFGIQHNMIAGITNGVAKFTGSMADVPQIAADTVNNVAVNPFLAALGMDTLSPAARFTVAKDLEKIASDYYPEIAKKPISELKGASEIGSWIATQAAIQAPQMIGSTAAAFLPKLRAAYLGLMGVSSGALQYQNDLEKKVNPRAAWLDGVTNSAFEVLGESLPFEVFDKIGGAIRKLPISARPSAVSNAIKKTMVALGSMAGQHASEGLGEGLTQIGQNASQRYVAGDEKQGIMDQVPEAAAIGAIMATPMGAIHAYNTAAAPVSKEEALTKALNDSVSSGNFARSGINSAAIQALSPDGTLAENGVTLVPPPRNPKTPLSNAANLAKASGITQPATPSTTDDADLLQKANEFTAPLEAAADTSMAQPTGQAATSPVDKVAPPLQVNPAIAELTGKTFTDENLVLDISAKLDAQGIAHKIEPAPDGRSMQFNFGGSENGTSNAATDTGMDTSSASSGRDQSEGNDGTVVPGPNDGANDRSASGADGTTGADAGSNGPDSTQRGAGANQTVSANEGKQLTYTKGKVVEAPVAKLALSKDVPQFKDGADEKGITQESRLDGKFDRRLAAPVQIWERKDGTQEVISGRHRLDLAQRSGESTIPAQIHREADGFTADHARMLDIELNVKDGRGKGKDYVAYFKELGITKNEAQQDGLLNTAIGRTAYTIAHEGSPSLIASHANDALTDQAAVAIAQNAPNNEALQNLGMKQIADGKNINHAVNVMRAARAAGFEGGSESGDLFGFDDSFAREAEAVAKEATRQQNIARQQLAAISGAAKRPGMAAQGGVEVKNPKATQARIDALKQSVADLDNFATNPDVYRKLRIDAGLTHEAQTAPVEQAQPENDNQPGFDLTGQTADEVKASEAAQDSARRDEEAQAKAEQAKKDQDAVDAKIKARTDNADNFQFGESSTDAAKPEGDLFSQPAPETKVANQPEQQVEKPTEPIQQDDVNQWWKDLGKEGRKAVFAKHGIKTFPVAMWKLVPKAHKEVILAGRNEGVQAGPVIKQSLTTETKPAAKTTDTRFANNKLVTADRMEELRLKLKKKLGTLNSGFDPELAAVGMEMAAGYIEAGARKFSDFTKAMVSDFGDAIKPYLRSFYESARHFPGLDTTGMTSAAEIDLVSLAQENKKTAEQKAVEDKAHEANPAVGKRVKQTKQTKNANDIYLQDDFGVSHINGYDNTTGEGASGPVKAAFLKDAKNYLAAVEKTLTAIGFEPHVNKKGKPEKAVSVNESGIAGSGDVSLTLAHPATGLGIYITIGGSALRGVVNTTKSGVQVMMRVATQADKFGGRSSNIWMPVNLSASDLAMAADSAVAKTINVANNSKQQSPSNEDSFKAGKDAFLAGELRQAPAKYLAHADAARNWLNGWDTANIDAPIENQNDSAQNEDTGGTQNARPIQTERVPGRDQNTDHVGESDRGTTGEPLDAGLAGQSQGADQGERVPGSVSDAGSTVQGSGSTGVQPSVKLGETGSAGNDGSTADTGLNDDITDADEIGSGGLVKKFKENVAAIKVLKSLEAENRKASPAERKALQRYVGFGALKGVFDPANKQWSKQHAELKELLTDAEFESARASIRNAHYTSKVVVDSIYQAVQRFGFASGRILEPSVGSGNFFGMMPTAMRNASKLHGVELDLLTSRLAQAIYPAAKVAVATGFEAYQVPSGFFDMAIGNPPFGSEPLVDRERSPYSGHSIHNYFIARMLDKTREGGIVPVIVTHSFLDAMNTRTRELIAKQANLIGALRLPNTAFKGNAGTEVVTDILFFQKTSKPEVNPSWIHSTDIELENPKSKERANEFVNNYFLENPRNVLGRQSLAGSMRSANEYTVEPTGDLKVQLNEAIDRLPANVYTPIERSSDELDSVDNTIPDGIKQGSYFIDSKGNVRQRGNDLAGNKTSTPWIPPNNTAIERMKGMINLRNVLREQMRLERGSDATAEEIEAHREKLNEVYDDFKDKKKFGFVNRQVNRNIFMDDTEAPLLQMIEFNYDKGLSEKAAANNDMEPREESATKADIFKRRVLFPPSERMNIESAKDALLASLDEKGRVDLDYMERAYGKTQDEILAELGDLVFHDPAMDDHQMADEYLSGDVKTKLAEAEKAAAENVEYQRNVDALTKVIPKDKLPSEIFASLGAGWIPAQIFNEFAQVVTGSNASRLSYLAATAQWLGELGDGGDIGKMHGDFGTDKISSFDLLKLAMNGRAPEFKPQKPSNGGEISNEARQKALEATEAAREKANKIKQAWESWVWNDAERAEQLAARFNDKHNRTVNRSYDGSHLVLHGMNPALKMRKHQTASIWRMVQDRNTLLDHVVGAGKTFAMVGAIMEMKRLGIARKPLLVVPNHLTMQWRTEFAKMYPAANILAATPEDFSQKNRERMFSKIALGDYDGVIIGHSSLTKIGLDPETEKSIYMEQIKEIADAIEAAKTERGDKGIVRDMEKIKANLEAKVKDLINKAGERDKVVTFNELGVDGLFVDEMHEFKNLFFVTQMQRVAGLGNPKGSGKAFDLFGKIRWLKNTYGDKAPLITATGTPVSNSLAEMFTMQRYMQYQDLKNEGLHLFDAWARMYGDVENLYEVAPSGVGYRLSQRFSKFKNLPSLMGNYRTFADTVTLQDLKDQAAEAGGVFPVPRVAGGKPKNIIAQRSQLQTDYFGVPFLKRDEAGNIEYGIDMDNAKIEQNSKGEWVVSDGRSSQQFATKEDAALNLVERALSPVLSLDPESLLGKFGNLAAITRATKGKVNALSLTGLASKAGLDMRILDPNLPDFEGSKINKSIDEMMTLYKQWGKDKGTQLVFCDMSIPLSARASMANKDRRLYIRDNNGMLAHKKGTLNVADGFDGFPFYLVKSGAKETARVAIYEPVTGQLIKSDFHTKADAKAWVASSLEKDAMRDKWYEMRESYPPIEQDEIGEYRDAHDLEVADDGSNEISMDDLEAAAGENAFSVYDDIKAKLMKRGVPEREIAFIHDFETPTKKDDLFKRVNSGDIRFLLGSTPKLGAGTNVQERIVGLHHIDAPWRPSDLEQREGRGIRQGNKLYARDPEGFELFIGRYATDQTYDTRRWQLLEHKASGIEQLRKYSGQTEIDDVAGEASNAADMKAAASGNPLVLEETQLANEVKRLTAMRKGHSDSIYAMQGKLSHNKNAIETFFPNQLRIIEQELGQAKKYPAKTGKNAIAETMIGRTQAKTREEAENLIREHAAKLTVGIINSMQINYRGIEFSLKRDAGSILSLHSSLMNFSGYNIATEKISPSGLLTRLENYIDSLPSRKERIEKNIEEMKAEVTSMQQRISAPFAEQGALEQAQLRHAVIKRRLMKSTQIEAVPQEEREAFNKELAKRKEALKQAGYEAALKELEAGDDAMQSHAPNKSEGMAAERVTLATAKLRAAWVGFKRIKVVQSVKDIPNELYMRSLRALHPIDRGTEGVYDPVTRTVYLVADNIASPDRAVWVAIHEVVGHGGIRMLGGLVTDALNHAGKNGFVNTLAHAIAQDRGETFTAKAHIDEAIAELAAATITGKVDQILKRYGVKVPTAMRNNLLGMIKRVIEAVRAFTARMLGRESKPVSDSDIHSMLKKMLRAVEGNDIDGGDVYPGSVVIQSRAGTASAERSSRILSKTESKPADSSALNQTSGEYPLSSRAPQQPITLNKPAAVAKSIPEETELQKRKRQVQDKMGRFKVIQDWLESNGVKLSDKANVHETENLMHAKVANQTEDFRDRVEKPLLERTADAGFTLEQIADYLEAQHIPEANERMRKIHQDAAATANGITDAEANQKMAEFQAMPKFAEFKKLADEYQQIGEETLDMRLREGLISKDQYDAYKATYKHWIPLRGDGKKPGVGKGLSVNAKEKRRLGHGERADGEMVLENLFMDRERAIYQIEHNKVVKNIIHFAMEANDPNLITIGKPVKRQVLKDQVVYEVQYKGRMMRAFSSESDAKAFINQAIALSTQNKGGGMVRSNFAIAKSVDPIVVMQASPMLAENEIQGYVAGHTIRIQLNDDLLARAATNMGVDQVNAFLSAGRAINNTLAKVYTAYSPDFIVRNAIRDFIAGTINLTGDMGIQMAGKIYANYPKAAKELFIARNDPRKSAWVMKYRAAGGNTGAAYLSDIERIGSDARAAMHTRMEAIQVYRSEVKRLTSAGKNAKYAHSVALMKAGVSKLSAIPVIGHFLSAVEHLNAVTENALRLATYITMTQNGYSEQKAAAAAKNSTVNFNRKGEISNVAGSLYLFFNASVQGSTRMFGSMLTSQHKGQAQALAGMLAMASFALAELGRGGDDDDERKWKNIPDYVKDHSFVIRAGGYDFTIPVPYEFAPFHVLGNSISDAIHGEGAWKSAMNVLKSFVDNTSPLGDPFAGNGEDGANLFQMTPTVVKMVLASHENENSFGTPIQPEKSVFSQNKPDSQNMYRNTKGTVYSGAAEWMNEMTGGSKYTSGGIDVSPETLKFWVSSLTGGTGRFVTDTFSGLYGATQGVAPDLRSIPIARVIAREETVSDSRRKFWEAASEARKSADAFAMARKAHDYTAAQDMRDQEGDMIRLAKMAQNFGKAAARQRDYIDEIRMDDNLPLADKRAQMKEIEAKEQEYYDRFLTIFDQTKKGKR